LTAKTKQIQTCPVFLQAVKGYFSMTHQFFADDDKVVQGNMTVAEFRRRFKAMGNMTELSNYAGYAYDAMWTYALALDKLVKSDPKAVSHLHSENTTR
jgi:ABC-type branched-subunit amino acid transport system substrate-binding protein